MRWIFYALLVANVAFFGWYTIVEQGAESFDVADAASVEDGVARIRLLTEIGEDVDVGLERRSGTEKCDVYGPFFSNSDGKSFLSMVKRGGFSGRVERENVELKPYYWAYISPQSSSRKAHALVNRLRGEQVNAEFIGEGRFRKGVSLGNFESQELISALQRRLAKFDILINFERKSRDYKQFWVLLNPKSESRMPAELRDKLIARYPDIFHQEKVCKPVASG
ncbi:MAG: hypothetical protein V7745_08630 [Pseudomonadales bacterium]